MDSPTKEISYAPFTPVTVLSAVLLLITTMGNLPAAQGGAEFESLERNFILGDTEPVLCSNHVPCYYTAPPLPVYLAHRYGRVQFGQFGCACTEGICQLDYQLDGYPRQDTCVYCGLECYSLGIYAILSGGTTPPPPPTSPLEPIDNDIDNNFGQPTNRFVTDNPDQTLEVDRRELPDDTTHQVTTRHPYTESPTTVTLGGIISTSYTEPTPVTQHPVPITNIPFPGDNSTIEIAGTIETEQPIITEDTTNSTNIPHTLESFTTISSQQTEEVSHGLPPGSPSPSEGFTDQPLESSSTQQEPTNATVTPTSEFTSEPNLTGSSDHMSGTAESEGAFATEEPATVTGQNLNTIVGISTASNHFNSTDQPFGVTEQPWNTTENTTNNLPTNATPEPQEGGTNNPITDTSQLPVDESTPVPSVATDAPINTSDSEQLLTSPGFVSTDQPVFASENPFGIDIVTELPLIDGGDEQFVSDKVAQFTQPPPTERVIVDPFATDAPSLETDFPDMGGDIENIGDNSESDLSTNQSIDESIGDQIDEFATEAPIATDFPGMGGDIDDMGIEDDLSDTGAEAGTNMQMSNEDYDFSSHIDMGLGTDAPPIDYEALENIDIFGNRDT